MINIGDFVVVVFIIGVAFGIVATLVSLHLYKGLRKAVKESAEQQKRKA